MVGTAAGAIATDLPVELLTCSGISDRNRRLDCYDDLASDLQAAELDEPNDDSATDVGGWKIAKETSPIDGSELI